jgi:hypothetical protein
MERQVQGHIRKKTKFYLAVAKAVLLLKHDSIGVTIPKCPTQVLKLTYPRLLLLPLPQVVVHLS